MKLMKSEMERWQREQMKKEGNASLSKRIVYVWLLYGRDKRTAETVLLKLTKIETRFSIYMYEWFD